MFAASFFHKKYQVDVASFLPETCEWNTYMCCWTGHDGQETMYGNTDICRVLDYPEEGDVLEMPRDDEGPVYWSVLDLNRSLPRAPRDEQKQFVPSKCCQTSPVSI